MGLSESSPLASGFLRPIASRSLDARFIDSVGVVRDSFTIIKGGPAQVPREARALSLGPPEPNPFHTALGLDYSLPRSGVVRLSVLDLAGRRVARVVNAVQSQGPHRAIWNGFDGRGRAVPPGVYLGVLEFGGEMRARKIVRTR